MPPTVLSELQANEIIKEYNKAGKDHFFREAVEKKILPYVAHTLLYLNCDKEFWYEVHEKYMHRNSMIIKLLDKIFLILNQEKMTKICVAENFASVLMSNTCLGCFCSGDIDLYCDDLDLYKLDNIMFSVGFELSDRHIRKKSFAKEYKSKDIIGEEFWLNFQWKPMTRKKTHLYDQRYIMKRYKDMFNYVRFYKDTNIKLFSPDVAIYLNCIHIASGHYYILPPSIRLYADIDRPVRFCNIDWNKIKEWAINDHLGIRTNVVFELAKLQLQTPIPDEAMIRFKQNKRAEKFINSLINKSNLEIKKPQNSKIHYLIFLIRVELCSDNLNMLIALIKRLWVILTDWK